MLEINNLRITFPAANGPFEAVKGISFYLGKGETLGIVGESGSGKSLTALSLMGLLPTAAQVSGEILFYPQQLTPQPPKGGADAGELKGDITVSSSRSNPKGGADTNERGNFSPKLPSTIPPFRGLGGATNLLSLPESSFRAYRGAEIAMIFQEPMRSLNPVFPCGQQVAEAIRTHRPVSWKEARMQALALFEQVKLPDPARISRAYPHELSGGQKQRVMIAMAMSCQPKVLIADEPTTALDVTVQQEILDLLRQLKDEYGLSMLFISHDLGLVSQVADRVAVMQQGQIVETGPATRVLGTPQHPYTKGLLACRPSLLQQYHRLPTLQDIAENPAFEVQQLSAAAQLARREALHGQPPLLEVQQFTAQYPARKNAFGFVTEWRDAVADVQFEIYPGESFGIVGESGCGKTTLGKAIVESALKGAANLTIPHNAATAVHWAPETERSTGSRLPRAVMVFQDPHSSLNPRLRAGEAIAEPLRANRLLPDARACRERAMELLTLVGLETGHYARYPHELSGGQRQRVCIARALSVQPALLICDEITSSLDVSVQAMVLNLLLDLRERLGLTYLFISHNLRVVHQICDRVLVMRAGKVEACGYPEEVYQGTTNEYVRRLVGAVG